MTAKNHASAFRTALNSVWARRKDRSAIKVDNNLLLGLNDDEKRIVRGFAAAVKKGEIKRSPRPRGKISTRRLAGLPGVDELRSLCQSIAMLDAIISPEWEPRYYSFNCKWAPRQMCASMRNGSGDDFFIHFSSIGALIKGFDHEAAMSPWSKLPQSYHGGQPGLWPGIVEQVPSEFADALKEPAFSWEATTFCIWRTYSDPKWRIGSIDFVDYDFWTNFQGEIEAWEHSDPDGSAHLLSVLDGDPRSYKAFADEYFAQEDGGPSDYKLPAIKSIYDGERLTAELVRALNPKATLRSLKKDVAEIGYGRLRSN